MNRLAQTSALAALQEEWIDDIAALQTLEGEWHELAERTRAEVYLRPAWLLTWWRHFGEGRRLACLILRREGQLAGLLPFVIEELRVGPLPLRLARLAGTDPHCIVFQAPIEADLATPAWRLAIHHLLGELGCDALSLTPVSDRAAHLPLLRKIGAEEVRFALRQTGEGEHVVFDLTGDFQGFFTSLSKGSRKKHKRDLRRLKASGDVSETVLTPDGRAFGEFVVRHNQQWQAIGRGGHFTDWPGSTAFYEALADGEVAESPMRLYSLTRSSTPLVTRFGLIGAGRVHLRLPARSTDSEIDSMGVGKVSLLMLIQTLMEQGVELIEDGRGHYDYKLSCGGSSVPVWQILLYPDTPRGRGRLKLLLGWSYLLNLLYYRIWFLKLAPRVQKRFGRRPRPLWRSWIRSRV